MTVRVKKEFDPERLGRFLAAVEWWSELTDEEKARVHEQYGGGNGLGVVVHGGGLVSVPVAVGDRRACIGALEAE